MTRTMLFGLAAAAVLAVLADVPAEAQQFSQQSGARSSHSGGINVVSGHQRARSKPQRSRQFQGGRGPAPCWATCLPGVHAVATWATTVGLPPRAPYLD
jgi:hypothetical protein